MAATKRRTKVSPAKKTRKSSKPFELGSHVMVPFGKRIFDAKVLDSHRDRITVEISIEGASEPLITSYRMDEVSPPS